jgi:hypothetical protein
MIRKILFLTLSLLFGVSFAYSQEKKDKSFEIYGHAMLDAGYNVNQIDPDWYDVIRPTKLPTYKDQFGTDGNWFMGVRQSRLGVKSWTPTDMGELKTQFEFELFGTGVDAGQTTFRLRHAYGQLGEVGAGQTWSPFMDPDVFPNSLEYWGPSGMVFFRNIQVRWMPLMGESQVILALEKPGASADQGAYSDRNELKGIKTNFPAPDVSAQYHQSTGFGYFQIAAIARYMKWVNQDTSSQYILDGDAMGWGVNLSSNINIDKDVVRLQVVYGSGVENYMNDAPVDVGIKDNSSANDPKRPIKGVTLPVLGVVAFLDHHWSDKFSSTVGYSFIQITNSDGQLDDAFKKGQYALANIVYYPANRVMMGAEVQWADRENFNQHGTNDFKPSDVKIQLSFKYNFSQMFYRD